MLFSINSFATEAGRSTTSPAATGWHLDRPIFEYGHPYSVTFEPESDNGKINIRLFELGNVLKM